jgi:hypothetical protein
MAGQIRVRSIKRREVDEDKLALAFVLLATILDHPSDGEKEAAEAAPESKLEAA